MNLNIVKSYIEEYKQNFDRVHDQEIYKWKAIKQFQDNFDINSIDFYSNLEVSLRRTGNLLDSGQYFPKKMLLENAERSPEVVREMFLILYDEDFDILERIENFRNDFKLLNTHNFGDLKDYQDHRAIIVYLALYYPERYFFYKFRMFAGFSERIGYTYRPVSGRIENVGHYHRLCELIQYEISQDQELLRLHENRLDGLCYRDLNLHVLTQDFIYAVVQHLNNNQQIPQPIRTITLARETKASELNLENQQIDFTPKIINYIQNDIENKRIGDLGELWVLKIEKEFLLQNGRRALAEKVKHVAKDNGDGLGFDILSYDLKGKERYIEVKTTKGKVNSSFFVTRNELERSKIEQDNFFIYRVYEFDETTEQAKLLKIKGDLTSICEIPVNYRVNLK